MPDALSFAWLQFTGRICSVLTDWLPIPRNRFWQGIILRMWGRAYYAGEFPTLESWVEVRRSHRVPTDGEDDGIWNDA